MAQGEEVKLSPVCFGIRKREEAIALIEGDRIGLGICGKSHTAEAPGLLHGQVDALDEEPLAESLFLVSLADSEPCDEQHRELLIGNATSDSSRKPQAVGCHGDIAADLFVFDEDIGDADLVSKLILLGEAAKERIKRRMTASKLTSIILLL